jgi:ArsR family transcriptional regulator, arsenate/arsenite/antimonite-responsive transcriptional repressor
MILTDIFQNVKLISMKNDMKKSIQIFKALGDRNRMRILKMLQHKNGSCVCEIVEVLGVVQSTTSTHLRILEEAGLIFSVKEGKWVNYYLNNNSIDTGIREVLGLVRGWMNDDPQVKSDVGNIVSTDRCKLCK